MMAAGGGARRPRGPRLNICASGPCTLTVCISPTPVWKCDEGHRQDGDRCDSFCPKADIAKPIHKTPNPGLAILSGFAACARAAGSGIALSSPSPSRKVAAIGMNAGSATLDLFGSPTANANGEHDGGDEREEER